MKKQLISMFILLVTMSCFQVALAGNYFSASGEVIDTTGKASIQEKREVNLKKIENFLYDSMIKNSLEQDHGRNVDEIMKKVNCLDSDEIEEIALHTPDLIQLGSGVFQHESRTAKDISGNWLNFADKWLTISFVAFGLLFLLILL